MHYQGVMIQSTISYYTVQHTHRHHSACIVPLTMYTSTPASPIQPTAQGRRAKQLRPAARGYLLNNNNNNNNNNNKLYLKSYELYLPST